MWVGKSNGVKVRHRMLKPRLTHLLTSTHLYASEKYLTGYSYCEYEKMSQGE